MARRTLAVFDLDHTLTKRDTYVPYLLGFLWRNPRAMLRTWKLPWAVARFKLGLGDNSQLKESFLAAFLAGTQLEKVGSWSALYVDRLLNVGIRAKAKETLFEHLNSGHETCLVTASPDLYVDLLATKLGVSSVLCTATEHKNRILSGKILGKNCHGEEKVRRLEAKLGIDRSGVYVIAYADDVSDLPLLRWADRGILVNASQAMRRTAERYGIECVSWD
jgi:HAD superfamily hydrolase (TIGR01490 family)